MTKLTLTANAFFGHVRERLRSEGAVDSLVAHMQSTCGLSRAEARDAIETVLRQHPDMAFTQDEVDAVATWAVNIGGVEATCPALIEEADATDLASKDELIAVFAHREHAYGDSENAQYPSFAEAAGHPLRCYSRSEVGLLLLVEFSREDIEASLREMFGGDAGRIA